MQIHVKQAAYFDLTDQLPDMLKSIKNTNRNLNSTQQET